MHTYVCVDIKAKDILIGIYETLGYDYVCKYNYEIASHNKSLQSELL